MQIRFTRTPFFIVLFHCLCYSLFAQEAYLDSLHNDLSSGNLSRDSVYSKFLDQSSSLDPFTRDSCYRMLSGDLRELAPSTAFDFTLNLSNSGITKNMIQAWEKCVSHISSYVPLDTFQLSKSLNYCAGAYQAKQKFSDAKDRYLQIISLVPPHAIDEELAIAHNNLGTLLNNQNDPGAALPNYLRPRRIFTQLFGADHVYIGVIGNNIGQVYHQLKDYEAQIEIQEKSLQIYLEALGREHQLTGNVYLNLGIAFKDNGNLEKSLNAFEECLQIREYLEDAVGVVAVMSEIAQCKTTFPDFYSSMEIEQAKHDVITKGVELFDSNHVSLRSAYNNYALWLHERGNVNQAIWFLQKAIEITYPQFLSQNVLDIPTVQEVGDVDFADVRLLENKAYFLYDRYHNSEDQKFLLASLRTFFTGDSLIEILKTELLNGISRNQLILEANDFYVNACRTAMKLFDLTGDRAYLDQGFIFTEKSRNWELIDRYLQTKRYEALSRDSILRQISDLRAQLPGAYDQKTGWANYLDKMVDVLLEELKRKYPDHFRFLYDFEAATLNDIRAFCRQHSVQWLHFFYLSSYSYGTVLCTPDTMSVQVSWNNADSIKYHRDKLLENIGNRDWAFSESGYALYRLIFGAHAKFLSPGTMYVSSAGYLDNIPFDILIDTPLRNTPLEEIADHFLVQDFAFSLVPSGTFGKTIWEDDFSVRKSVFVAPEYADQALKYNTEEIKNGSLLLDGEFITGQPDKAQIPAWLKSYDLLHFAGHSYAQTTTLDSIFLLMGNGNDTLFVSELFSIESSAKLAVLSSCYSAAGKGSKEGNIGLAYGFAFAGTPNVISSMWSVSDRESQGFFNEYYQGLRNGLESIDCLQQAKLSYLSSAPLPARHPYFWANWTYYGHPVSYKSSGFQLWIPMILGLILVFTGYFVYRRYY